jgi:hypothetical protein
MNATIYNQITGEARTLPQVQAEHLARNSRGEWSAAPPLPKGWDREVPRYRASMNLQPSAFARHRSEAPFTSCSDTNMWQYGEAPVSAGQEIETTAWPHASMIPLNETAKHVLEFYKSRQRSRLPQSPWRAGRLFLDDGLSGVVPHDRLAGRRVEPAVPSPIRAAVR